MIFSDSIIETANLQNAQTIADTIVRRLCGKRRCIILHPDEVKTIELMISEISELQLSCESLNELLLVLRQNRVSEGFFDFFFSEGANGEEQLRNGIKKFRGFSMLCFGNYKYAFRFLSKLSKSDIEIKLRRFLQTNDQKLDCFGRKLPRAESANKIIPIPKEDTSLLGYISMGKERKEREYLDRWDSHETSGILVNSLAGNVSTTQDSMLREEAKRVRPFYQDLEKKRKATHEAGESNTYVYLTWDIVDVYIATSMRQQWEFEDVYDFCQNVFQGQDEIEEGGRSLASLRLRVFDPTQCVSANRIDKGLIEGLMLNRVFCTIYMVQESDTLGKDSELASTLAQQKPVIAYIPTIPDIKAFAKKVENQPLEYLYTRLNLLIAEGAVKDVAMRDKLSKLDAEWETKLATFFQKYERFKNEHPFTLANTSEAEFKNEDSSHQLACNILAILEAANFEKRANTLQNTHPLGIQVDLQTGVANGLLVARSEKQCRELVMGFLDNSLHFVIKHIRIFDLERAVFEKLKLDFPQISQKLEYDASRRFLVIKTELTSDEIKEIAEWAEKTLEAKPLLKFFRAIDDHGVDVLEEAKTSSFYRVITNDEKLTNSFWNFFLTLEAKSDKF